MNQRIARLRTHQENIERYQSLLETKLNDVERQFVERRLSEERFAIAMLQFIGASPISPTSKRHDLSDAIQ
jgi:hypothetical protein